MAKWWQRFADFLHTANLIPLVVLVSSYHYFHALRSHDPVLVAIPIALFVDLLHFRTVQQAVKSRTSMWQLTAVFTTLLTFGLQYIFYSQPGEGETLGRWQVILFASIVPVGLAIMAWHHQGREQEQVTDWQKLIAEAQQRAEVMQQEVMGAQTRADQTGREAERERQRTNEMQARAEAAQTQAVNMQNLLDKVQQEAAAEHKRANQMQQEAEIEGERAATMQTQLAAMQVQAEEMRSQLERVQAEANRWQTAAQDLQTIGQAWQALNPEMQTLALFNAQLLTAQNAAEKLGVHVTTIRRKARQLNGVGEEN
ncbi:MAG: hypothetical protein KJ069_29110 [Anaerolineae bacterium]|nr:hypothetical protein [Anaerolineae bacterium]